MTKVKANISKIEFFSLFKMSSTLIAVVLISILLTGYHIHAFQNDDQQLPFKEKYYRHYSLLSSLTDRNHRRRPAPPPPPQGSPRIGQRPYYKWPKPQPRVRPAASPPPPPPS